MINKVFGIGANKTGTTTPGKALIMLGLVPQAHWAHSIHLAHYWRDNALDPEIIIHFAKSYKSFQDFPWNHTNYYQYYDRHIPNSKFILTVRDTQNWFDSLVRWTTLPEDPDQRDILWRVERRWNQKRNGMWTIEAYQRVLEKRYNITKRSVKESKEAFTVGYEKRNAEIQEYFKDRPDDILVVNWENGDGWNELCRFLGVPAINVPFPQELITKGAMGDDGTGRAGA